MLDRLTAKAAKNLAADSDMDPSTLRVYFEKTLFELQNVRSRTVFSSTILENQCRVANESFLEEIKILTEKLTEAGTAYKELDEKINKVTGRMINLTNQLEPKNSPRESLQEARALILEFFKFLGAGGGTFSNVTGNSQADEYSLIEKATSIRALHALCLELPDDERFLEAKQRITVASQNLENLLVKRFRYNFSTENCEMMKKIAEVLAFSKSHSGCADVFIDEMLKTLPTDLADLSSIPDALREAEKIIIQIFHRPENVVFHLIQALFSRNLKAHLHSKVNPESNSEVFLVSLYTEYSNLENLVYQLIDRLHLLSDEGQLFKLLSVLVSDLLTGYQNRDLNWVKINLSTHLSAYYNSIGHTKRNLNASNLADIRRDLQMRLHLSDDRESELDKPLLSQEVAVSMLDDVRNAAKRCLLLVKQSDRPQFGKRLFQLLSQYLIVEHVEYGLTLALQALNTADTKASDPNFNFFAVVNEATTIFNFFEKAVNEFIGPLFIGSPSDLQECSTRRKALQNDLELKLSTGLERCLMLALSRIQNILLNEQKKTDYRGENVMLNSNAMSGLPSSSLACQHVCSFIQKVIINARSHLDGQNLISFMADLGTKFHRMLLDHFYGFTFSDTGGFVAMQDVTAYRDAARDFKNSTVDYLFDVLLKLMNLMLIKPQNVQQVWQDYIRSGIPKELMANFLQLRVDYKSAKLQSEIRDYLG